MTPQNEADFFGLAPPAGRTRESSIELDGAGRFWHDGAVVSNPAIASAFSRWLRRHPDNGRYVLSNGYDWTYLKVLDAPYLVHSLVFSALGEPRVALSDGTEEPLAGDGLRIGRADALYCLVKLGAFEARFSTQAQTALAPLLVAGPQGEVRVRIGGREFSVQRTGVES